MMRLIVLILIFILEFVIASLPYKLHKKLKVASKLELASICTSSLVKVLFLYLIIAPIHIILLKIRLQMPFDEIIQDIYKLLDYLKKLTKIKYNKIFLKLLEVNTKIL